jgi:hypothetical protein
MHENDIAREVVDAAYAIHTKLGPGLLESIYEVLLAYELKKRGLSVVRQVPVDLLVEDKVIVEVKSIEKVANIHKKQLLTYLRLTNKKIGLLINFNEELIRVG